MRVIIIILFFLANFLVTSVRCQSKQQPCREDSTFIGRFNESMETIKASELLEQDITIEKKVNAILFLNAVTGVEAKVDDPHIALYKNREELYDDLKKWQNWLEANRCSMTWQKADSLVRKYNGDR